MRPFLFFMLVFFGAPQVPGAEQRFNSGPNRVSLIELYTSEGCSSCPPAERWLGALREAPGLWRDFVPVAMHVNYWDRLGWTDRFASRQFTEREYAYAKQWSAGNVYTPCFVRDGIEWHAGSRPPAASRDKVGVLSVSLREGGLARVEFSPASIPRSTTENLEVHVALLGSGFSSKVTAGENRGETLRHEFVALALESHALPPSDGAGYRAEFPLPRAAITDAPRHAVAVWITRQGGLIPVQATGGWLEPK
jgi:hypothetical protein